MPPALAAPLAPEIPLDLAAAADRLAPFLGRVRAEAAGMYCSPLPWPPEGGLVPNPASHWAKFRGRFPTDLAPVLRPLAAAWAAGDQPLASGWPAAPEAFQWEYSRLVAWFKASPADVLAQAGAWEGSVTAWRNPLADMAKAEAEALGHRATQPGDRPAPAQPWPPTMAERLAVLERVTAADLPPSAQLRPGVTIADPAGWLAYLCAVAAKGPGGVLTSRGILEQDLADLAQLVRDRPDAPAGQPMGFRSAGATSTARLTSSRPSTAPASGTLGAHPIGFQVMGAAGEAIATSSGGAELAVDVTPAEHLAELGGYAAAVERFGRGGAHLLWDAARLWERDQATERAEQWAAQYRATWRRLRR